MIAWKKWDEMPSIGAETIAFTGELQLFFQTSTSRPPPFNCLLLAFAATRGNWPEQSKRLHQLLEGTPARQDTLALLNRVHLTATEKCTSTQDRIALIILLLDSLKPFSTRITSSEFGDWLEAGFDDAEKRTLALTQFGSVPTRHWILHTLRLLHKLLSDFTPERFVLRRQTGLDDLLDAPEIELPDNERVRRLLKTLLDDEPELAQMSRLASQIMSVVSLPQSIEERSAMPIGGVSDISNRGSLDQLLVSELAHDDLTLAVRVATNEALYLRRESPPASKPKHRAIILDTGLRTWGLPRVYNTATALALLATADEKSEIEVFRLNQDRYESVDLTTKEGLTEHLSALSPQLRPTKAWEALAPRLDMMEDTAAPVFITAEDTMRGADFLQRIHPQLARGMFVATANRTGEFHLSQWSAHGQKPLRSAKFDLQQITKTESLFDDSLSANLPAIDRLRSFPLFLSTQLDATQCWYIPGRGGFQITRDGRLLQYTTRKQGGRQLGDRLGKLQWVAPSPIKGQVIAITLKDARSSTHCLHQIGETDVITHELALSEAARFCCHNEDVFVVHPKSVMRVDLETGMLSKPLPIEKLYQAKGWNCRFFYAFKGGLVVWKCLSWDGLAPVFTDVTTPSEPRVETLFETPGHEGILAVLTDSRIVDLDSKDTWLTHKSVKSLGTFERVGRTGRSLTYFNGERNFEVSLHPDRGVGQKARWQQHWSRGRSIDVDRELQLIAQVKSTRVRLRAIGVCVGVGLVFETKREKLVAMRITNNVLQITPQTSTVRHSRLNKFRATRISNFRGRYSVATFSDGSQATVDRRGLLHLKSSSVDVPEATFVLFDSEVAGWLSTGQFFGPRYFHGQDDVIPATEVFQDVISPFMRHIAEAELESTG